MHRGYLEQQTDRLGNKPGSTNLPSSTPVTCPCGCIPGSQVARLPQLTEDGSNTSSEMSEIYYPKCSNAEEDCS